MLALPGGGRPARGLVGRRGLARQRHVLIERGGIVAERGFARAEISGRREALRGRADVLQRQRARWNRRGPRPCRPATVVAPMIICAKASVSGEAAMLGLTLKPEAKFAACWSPSPNRALKLMPVVPRTVESDVTFRELAGLAGVSLSEPSLFSAKVQVPPIWVLSALTTSPTVMRRP